MNGYIYKLRNISTNEVYIGQTIKDPKVRLSEHISQSLKINSESYNTLLHKAIRKYGKELFEFVVILDISEKDKVDLISELNRWESYYIGKFDSYENGYNSTIGGSYISKNTRDNSVPIIQLTMFGEFIREWRSASEASNILKIGRTNIAKCCANRCKSSGGYRWVYKSHYKNVQ